MLTVQQLSQPNNLLQVQAEIEDVFADMLPSEAREYWNIYQEFLLTQPRFSVEYPDVADQYREIFVRIGFLAVPLLEGEVVAALLRDHLRALLSMPEYDLRASLRSQLTRYHTFAERNEWREKYRKAIIDCDQLLTVEPITIGDREYAGYPQNWISDVLEVVDIAHPDALSEQKYFTTSKNFQRLPQDERTSVKSIITAFVFLLYRSDSDEGYEDDIEVSVGDETYRISEGVVEKVENDIPKEVKLALEVYDSVLREMGKEVVSTTSTEQKDTSTVTPQQVAGSNVDYGKRAEQIVEKIADNVPAEKRARVKKNTELFLRNVRNEVEMKDKLTRPEHQGGVALPGVIADQVVAIAKSEKKGANLDMRVERAHTLIDSALKASAARQVKSYAMPTLPQAAQFFTDETDQATRKKVSPPQPQKEVELPQEKSKKSVSTAPAPQIRPTVVPAPISQPVSTPKKDEPMLLPDELLSALDKASQAVQKESVSQEKPRVPTAPTPQTPVVQSPAPKPVSPVQAVPQKKQQPKPLPRQADTFVAPVTPPAAPKPIQPTLRVVRRSTTDPFQELSSSTLELMRGNSLSAQVWTDKVLAKVKVLAQQGVAAKDQAKMSWKSSPIYAEYIALGKRSFTTGKPIAEVIHDAKSSMTVEEFLAVSQLNASLDRL